MSKPQTNRIPAVEAARAAALARAGIATSINSSISRIVTAVSTKPKVEQRPVTSKYPDTLKAGIPKRAIATSKSTSGKTVVPTPSSFFNTPSSWQPPGRDVDNPNLLPRSPISHTQSTSSFGYVTDFIPSPIHTSSVQSSQPIWDDGSSSDPYMMWATPSNQSKSSFGSSTSAVPTFNSWVPNAQPSSSRGSSNSWPILIDLDEDQHKNHSATKNSKVSSPMFAVVDESWELTDPNPDIHALLVAFNRDFFYDALGAVEVKWSKRMTSCAGICSFSPKGGACIVTLSEPLLKLRPRRDMVETLLHEMIHAYLFLYDGTRDREAHGPLFLDHMHRINKMTGAKISVYHSFHEEVRHHQTHWWRCEGPCKDRKPFYGYVKRSMNRAPGPNDTWYSSHQMTCGGTFVKIREPPKKEKAAPTKVKAPTPLENWLKGQGKSKR